jgi:hypothetical protein
MDNLPELPQLFQSAMPVEIPRASFKQNSVSLFFGNVKRRQLVKATKAEAEIAEYSRQAVHSKLEMFHEIITYSARAQDTFAEYKHRETMRGLEVEEKRADIYIKNAQAQLIGYEVKLSELDLNIKLKQYKKMEEDTDVGGGNLI